MSVKSEGAPVKPTTDTVVIDGTQQRQVDPNLSIDNQRESKPWELDDAPKGSTSESVLVYEGGKPVRVSGPTHYAHLADGRIVGSYGGGTEYTDEDGKVTKIIAHHAG